MYVLYICRLTLDASDNAACFSSLISKEISESASPDTMAAIERPTTDTREHARLAFIEKMCYKGLHVDFGH